MSRTLLLDALCGQKRLAVFEDGALCEMHIERAGTGGISGNIYTGHVKNVLPGMNAAFVDIGLDKNAFMHAGDIKLDTRGDNALAGTLEKLNISALVRPGQQIMAQVIKEPGGGKGPRVSGHITLPGRLMALLPTMKYIGISRKIEDEERRRRLRDMAHGLMASAGMGMIMRTAAEYADPSEIADEYAELIERWRDIEKRGRVSRAPALIHGGDGLETMAVRDIARHGDELIADDEAMYDALLAQTAIYAPGLAGNIRLHTGDMPLFDVRGVDSEYEKLLRRRVWLKSGGYLVIDYTEALTVIDVNTGKYVGKSSQEETILRTNREASVEVARQLRLRDAGGIIIVDFIDMADEAQREELLEFMKAELSKDRTPATAVDITPLGLMEITRMKRRLSEQKLRRHLCPTCGGAGEVDDYETVARRILYDLRRRHRRSPDQAYIVRLSSGVAGALIAIGAPKGVKAHVSPCDMPDGEYAIDPVDMSALPEGAKLLRTVK